MGVPAVSGTRRKRFPPHDRGQSDVPLTLAPPSAKKDATAINPARHVELWGALTTTSMILLDCPPLPSTPLPTAHALALAIVGNGGAAGGGVTGPPPPQTALSVGREGSLPRLSGLVVMRRKGPNVHSSGHHHCLLADDRTAAVQVQGAVLTKVRPEHARCDHHLLLPACRCFGGRS